jgi:WG containing repeat
MLISILFLSASNIDNIYALVASVCATLAAALVGVKSERHAKVFYSVAALSGGMALLFAYSYNNVVEIEATKEIAVNHKITELTIELEKANTNKVNNSTLLDTCNRHLAIEQSEIKIAKERLSNSVEENRDLSRELKEMKAKIAKYRGSKSFAGVAPAQHANGKWGYQDKRQNMVIDYKYKQACTIWHDRGGVQDFNGKWGFVDSDGHEQISCKYDYAKRFEKRGKNFFAEVKEKGLWIKIDKNGNTIEKLNFGDTAGLQ